MSIHLVRANEDWFICGYFPLMGERYTWRIDLATCSYCRAGVMRWGMELDQ